MRFFIPFISLFFISSGLTAQIIDRSRLSDSAPYGSKEVLKSTSLSSADIKNLYMAAVSRRIEFLNGKEYVPYFYRSKTTPLMFSGTPFHATLFFNKRVYNNITLQYDTFIDEAVYTDTSRLFHSELPRATLNKNLIEGFSFILNGQRYNFSYLHFTPTSVGMPGDGYYEVVYEGPSKFIIKHKSIVYLKDAIDEYKYSDLKYILSGNEFRKISNLKEFLALFGDKSEVVRNYIRNEKLRFRKADKTQISAILQYYDNLTRQEKN